MPEAQAPDTALSTARVMKSSPAAVFAAFASADVLARWWGPDGFTNTFELFDFQPSGRWVFTMHGPDGGHYANESIFADIVPGERIVLDHIVEPRFRLTVTLAAVADGTCVSWTQAFATPELAAKMAGLCTVANEQVLSRLQAIVEAPAT